MTPPSVPSRTSVLRIAIVVEGGLVLAAVILGWLFGQPPLSRCEWTVRAALLGLAAAAPMLVGLVILTRWPGPFAELEEVVQRIIVLFRSSSLLELAAICALAGLGEEMLFRGVVQAGIERVTGSPWLAIAAAGVIFGLAHPITPVYAGLAGMIGVYLGWLFVASGNLMVPIVTHAAYDFAALVYLLHGTETPGGAEIEDTYGQEWSL